MNLADMIEKLTLLVPLLLVVGAGWKYLPVVRNAANEFILPVLNALVAFVAAFAAPPAQAAIFGDIGKALSLPAQLFLSMAAAALAALIHDKFVKPITPKSPYTKSN